MRSRRLPPGLLLIVPVIAVLGLYAFTQGAAAGPADEPSPTPTAALQLTPVDAADALLAEAIAADVLAAQPPAAGWVPADEPPALMVHGDFHDRAWVRVNAGAGDCLNARNAPSLTGDFAIPTLCLPDGSEGMLTGPAIEADGHWWWHLAGAGYVAEDYLVYLGPAGIDSRTVPELAGYGRIAYVRNEHELWLMDADGANQRKIADHAPAPGLYRHIYDINWSRDGSMLAYTLTGHDVDQTGVALHILLLDEAGGVSLKQSLPGVRGGNWSPDGRRLGVIFQNGSTLVGYIGVPGVVDIDGAQLRLPVPEGATLDRAPSFNYDGTLILAYYSAGGEGAAFYRRSVFDATTGTELHGIGIGDYVGWWSGNRWSPVDNRIAFFADDNDGGGYYGIYDFASGEVTATVDAPEYSENVGGYCGSPDMMRMEWAPDGSRIYYRFSMGDTGDNGIWAWDPVTGDLALTQAGGAGYPTAGPRGLVAFDAWSGNTSYIFVGHPGGAERAGAPELLAEGSQPAWWSPAVLPEDMPPTPTPSPIMLDLTPTAAPGSATPAAGTPDASATATSSSTPTPANTETPAATANTN
jgi:Tol biopolymer transport system component